MEFDWDWRDSVFRMLWSQGPLEEPYTHSGWSVYRNTVQRACLEALRANFPSLLVLMGEDAFGALARAYLNEHPPQDARLLHYGAELVEFLSEFKPAQPWPQWVDIAWLDRSWIESHVAPDARVLEPADVLNGQKVQTQQIVKPHPATRWRSSEQHPIASLWLDARRGSAPVSDLEWKGEAVMLTRNNDGVSGCRIGRAEVAFLQACTNEETLESALSKAWEADPSVDLSALIACMLEQGALAWNDF